MFLFTSLYLDRVDYVKAKCYHYYLFFFPFTSWKLTVEALSRKRNNLHGAYHQNPSWPDKWFSYSNFIRFMIPLNNQSQKGLKHYTSQAKDVFHIRHRIYADRFLLTHAGITVASIPRSYLTPNMKTFNGGVSQTFCKRVK